jgi:hypothetical protein
LDRHPGQRFKEALSGLNVVPDIDVEIGSPAFPHPGLSREVEYVGHAGQETRQVDVLKRCFLETESRPFPYRIQVGFFERARVIVCEAVNARYARARIEQRGSQMRADEPGGAGDQCVHSSSPRM